MTPSPHTPAQERLLRLREERRGATILKKKQDKNKPPSRVKNDVQARLLNEQALNQGKPGKGKRSRNKPPQMVHDDDSSEDDDDYCPRGSIASTIASQGQQSMASWGAKAAADIAAAETSASRKRTATAAFGEAEVRRTPHTHTPVHNTPSHSPTPTCHSHPRDITLTLA